MLPLRSKWMENEGPQLGPIGRWETEKRGEDNDGGAGACREEYQTNHLTKEVAGGMEGRSMCVDSTVP